MLLHIERLKPHNEDKSFKNKIKEIRRDVKRQRQEITDLAEARIRELLKGLSPARNNQFHQFEADESHVGDQCQVCLEEFEVRKIDEATGLRNSAFFLQRLHRYMVC